MKRILAGNLKLRIGLTGAAFVSGVLLCGPAAADRWGISIGSNAVGFSYNSGGYCDDYGCPGNYWDDPVYYCPVYFRHRWYRGPVYYSRRHGDTLFWIHGGWRHDEWGGPRPPWACNDRYGSALDLYFYQSNGFRVRDSWWNSWGREHNDWYWRDHPDWSRNQTSRGANAQGHEWDRDRSWAGANHAWGHAGGEGFNRGSRAGATMEANPPQNAGGNQGADHAAQHRGSGRRQNSFQDQSGGQPADQGYQHGDTSGGSNPSSGGAGGQKGGQGNSHSDNAAGMGATQTPSQTQGGGQAVDQGGRHHGKAGGAPTNDQGTTNGTGGNAATGQGSDSQGKDQSQGGSSSGNSGNDKGSQKHDHQHDQPASQDNGNGGPH
jgi:hypothetical protein